MRDLQECQAEVFRRSEKRINEIKQRRKHALVACVPLALCLAVISVFAFPEMKPTDIHGEGVTTNPAYEMFATTAGNDVTLERFAGSVNISGKGISLSYTSEDTVQGIIQMLDQIVFDSEKNDVDQFRDFTINQDVSTGVCESNKKKGYKIFIKRNDETSAEYLLLGSLLIDQNTQKQFRMDEETYVALKNALGIPQN